MECFLTLNNLKTKGIQHSPDQGESTTVIKPKCQQQNKCLLREKKKNHGEQRKGIIATKERYFRYFTLTLHIWTNAPKIQQDQMEMSPLSILLWVSLVWDLGCKWERAEGKVPPTQVG